MVSKPLARSSALGYRTRSARRVAGRGGRARATLPVMAHELVVLSAGARAPCFLHLQQEDLMSANNCEDETSGNFFPGNRLLNGVCNS